MLVSFGFERRDILKTSFAALHGLIGTTGSATSYHCNFSDLDWSLVFIWPLPCFQERVERVVPAAPVPAVPQPARTLQGNELSDNAPRPPPRWGCGTEML